MTTTTHSFDDFDHEKHMQQALELARDAADRGDNPFGTVLVRDDTVVMAESNRVNTADDIRRHPELDLAARACRAYTPAERAAIVMYTSTEPCPMCAGGLRATGLGRIVYSVGGDEIGTFTGSAPTVRSGTVLEGITEVTGPVLHEAGRQVHREFEW